MNYGVTFENEPNYKLIAKRLVDLTTRTSHSTNDNKEKDNKKV
ncbi:hypothetical protein ACIQXQ_09455 [Peribacillus sp. NPDC097198]